jgi:inactivated superfamily I helicase
VDKLKKIIFLLTMLALGSGLFAQSGLFNLSYGMTLAEADSILTLATFHAEGSEKNAVKYYSDINEFVSAVLVFLEPNTQRVAGWFIKYDPENGEDNDHLVIDRISNMHGETNHFEEETQQLIWFLTNTRTLHVMYAQDGSLTALYYDSYFADLFDMGDQGR